MLNEIQVKNFAIIDDALLNFSKGLNILTGETGAGKTLVIEAINLLMGNRADNSLIRDGETKLLVQGYFDLSKNQLAKKFLMDTGLCGEDESFEEIVLAREVNRQGKNRAYINGIFVQVSTLKELGKLCIDIHGQHDHQYLLESKNHLKIIDKFSKKHILEAKKAYRAALGKYLDLKDRLERLASQQQEKEKKLRDLKFKAEEIEALNIKEDEDLKLENEKRILKNHEKIFELCTDSINKLKGDQGSQGSLVDSMGEIKQNISQLARIDNGFEPYVEDISSISGVLDDLSHYLNSYISDFDYSPQKLDQIQERLYRLDQVKKKYGMELPSLKGYASRLRDEIDEVTDIDSRVDRLKKSLGKIEDMVRDRALKLSGLRKEVSSNIGKAVVAELKDLSFRDCVFKIDQDYDFSEEGIYIGKKKVRLTEEGIDRIEFLVSLNKGQNPRQLKKIASGGEVSRIMLALKSIIGSLDFISTMVFDEIDSGIGGATSLKVGQKLFKISNCYQVICITHLAQIASFADSHYFIEKYIQDGKTKIKVAALDDRQKIKELSRMLSGMEDSSISFKHAEELLSKCEKAKKETVERI